MALITSSIPHNANDIIGFNQWYLEFFAQSLCDLIVHINDRRTSPVFWEESPNHITNRIVATSCRSSKRSICEFAGRLNFNSNCKCIFIVQRIFRTDTILVHQLANVCIWQSEIISRYTLHRLRLRPLGRIDVVQTSCYIHLWSGF